MTAPLTEPTALNLGAGTAAHLPGAVRLDRARVTHPHVVADLDHPLPFRDASFKTVGAFDVVEHVADLIALFEEVHRVLRPGGRFVLTTPHYSSANAYTDPTHRRALGLRSFDYFTAGNALAFYSRARFRKAGITLHFKGKILGRLLFHVARRWPAWYEERLAWVFPAWFLYVELEAEK